MQINIYIWTIFTVLDVSTGDGDLENKSGGYGTQEEQINLMPPRKKRELSKRWNISC